MAAGLNIPQTMNEIVVSKNTMKRNIEVAFQYTNIRNHP